MPDNRQLALLALAAAAAAGLYICVLLTLPFLPALAWGLVLAIVLLPLQIRAETLFRRRNLAALFTVSAAALLLALVIFFVVQQLLHEAASGAAYLEAIVRGWDSAQLVQSYPRLAGVLSWLREQLDPAGAISRLAQWLTEQSTTLLRGSINQGLTFVLTFYLLFYFLRDRDKALATLSAYLPMETSESRRIFARVAETVQATIVGTVAVAAVQGTLGGLMFWWLGLPTPVFWGLVMGLLAVVPVLGAFVIWVPAAIFLAFEGQWTSALILSLWGGLIVAGIDNLLYPILVGARLRLHTVVTFIAAVGGILLFGASGLVLGPVTVAVTLALVEMIKARQNPEVGAGPGSEI